MEDNKHPYETNPLLVLGIIIITLGLYSIFWIYLKNKELELIKKECPDSKRGIIILMIFPLITAIILYISYLFTSKIPFLFTLYIMVTILSFFVLKYLFDFSLCSAITTRSNIAMWFLPFCISYSGGILLILQHYSGIVLLLTSLVHIPILQHSLNICYRNLKFKHEKLNQYN